MIAKFHSRIFVGIKIAIGLGLIVFLFREIIYLAHFPFYPLFFILEIVNFSLFDCSAFTSASIHSYTICRGGRMDGLILYCFVFKGKAL